MGRVRPRLAWLAVLLALVSTWTSLSWAGDSELEWGPIESYWEKPLLLTGAAAADEYALDKATGMLGNAPRTGSVSLERQFLFLVPNKNFRNGDWDSGSHILVAVSEKPFRTCGEGAVDVYRPADPKTCSLTCRNTSFQGLRAVWIRARALEPPPSPAGHTINGNTIAVDIGSGRTLIIGGWDSTTANQLAACQKRYERFVSQLRITGGSAPPVKKKRYHAVLRIRRNYRPGEYLSPKVAIYDQDGNALSADDVTQIVFYFNGVEGETRPWDGSRTKIEAHISTKDHVGATASGVIPAWRGAQAPAPTPTVSVPPPPLSEQPVPRPPVADGAVPGLGGAGRVPGPRSLGEALGGILGPAAIGLIGAFLGGILGGGTPPPPVPEGPAPGSRPPSGPSKPPGGGGKKRSPKKKAVPPPPVSEKAAKKEAVEEEKKKRPPKRPARKGADGRKKEQDGARADGEKAKEGYWTHVFHRVRDGLKEVGRDIYQGAKDIYHDPGLILQTAKNSAEEVKNGLKAAGGAISRGARYVGNGVLQAVKHPLDTLGSIKDFGKEALGTMKEIVLHPMDFAHALGGAMTTVKDTVANVGKAVLHTISDAYHDPDKLVDLVKSLTGIEDFEKSIESGRSLGSRIGHSLMGTLGLYGAAEGLGAAREGASRLLAGGGKEAVAVFGDDGLRIVARAAGRTEGLADDAARLAGKAAGVTDDAVRAGGRAAGSAVDDAARAGGRVAESAGDDVARAGGQAAEGAADDVARARDAAGDASRGPVSSNADDLEQRAAAAETPPEAMEGTKDFVETDVVPDTSGYTEATERGLRDFAEENNVQVYTRPTTSRASELLKNGEAVPKPQFVKNKTINSIDAKYLGASEENIGKVGSFEPRRPTIDDLKDLPLEEQQRVMGRYHQRVNEYRDQAKHLAENEAKGLCKVENGVVYDAGGKPYTGDVDVYAIRGPHGEKLSPERVAELEKELRRRGINVEHGAHENWDMSHLKGEELRIAKGIDHKIRQSHGIGGEALVTYKPGASKSTASWVDNTIQLGYAP